MHVCLCVSIHMANMLVFLMHRHKGVRMMWHRLKSCVRYYFKSHCYVGLPQCIGIFHAPFIWCFQGFHQDTVFCFVITLQNLRCILNIKLISQVRCNLEQARVLLEVLQRVFSFSFFLFLDHLSILFKLTFECQI